MKAIINAQVVIPEGIIENGCILFENGRILAAGRVIPPAGAEITDAHGLIAGPGYVDIHCHAGGKYLSYEDPVGMAAHHLRGGTTSLCATLAYSLTREQLFGGIELVKQAMETGKTTIEGIHFEGPYLNPQYGANAQKAWKVDNEEIMHLLDAAQGYVRQMTYSPELEGIEYLENLLASRSIPMALGHTEMSTPALERAVAAGATIITHLFDAMGAWRPIKETGLIQETAAEVALAQEGLYYELICDTFGVHVKPANMRLALRAATADNLILITDATMRMYDPSEYPPDDKRSNPDVNYNERQQISGSSLTMERAVRNMKKYTNAGIEELFIMAARNPAIATGIFDRVGSLEAGKVANIVLCEQDMSLSAVFFRGEAVER